MSLGGGPGSEATADKYRVNVTRERWTCRALGMKRLLLFQCLRVCFYPEKSNCYEGPSREPVRWPQDGSTAVSPSLWGNRYHHYHHPKPKVLLEEGRCFLNSPAEFRR